MPPPGPRAPEPLLKIRATAREGITKLCLNSGNATRIPQASSGFSSEICNVSFEESRVILVVVYSAVCALGLPANCLTAWLTLLQVLQGNVLAVYLFCLALCELLYISTLPLWLIYIQNQHHWMLGLWACKVTAYIFFCNIYISILFLCCVSCDRFMAIVYALESRGHRHQKAAIFISVGIFILVGLIHYPVFEMEDRETCFETLPMDERIAGYHYARFAIGFAIPLSIIAFTNHRIFRSIKVSGGLTAAQKAKVKHLVIAVVVIFLVCFAPYHLVLLIKAVAFSYYRGDREAVCAFEARLYTVSVVFLCLSTVNSVADPIIYVLATDHSRQEVSKIHKEWKKRSTKTDVTKLTCSKDSMEMRLPPALTNDFTFPRPVHPPGSQLGMQGSPCTSRRLMEFC
ncbi:PREDICTED: probable G-protein coupled receptor 132 [Galeopterus variegatus]|uniref:Probable G-protein coupled receptor 132 n=1 Tax=Galeopterus variegatus TaxID=482537 RepID=A0ABM0QVV7_GALVR|nr:PREDICTED: probable G-protein coupled receptor 132 [Galeopterus variegatus]